MYSDVRVRHKVEEDRILTDWHNGGSDVSEYPPYSRSSTSDLSWASSASSVHPRCRSRSSSRVLYSLSVTTGDGTGPPERHMSDNNSKGNGVNKCTGQRLHIDERFLETVLGDHPSLRVLLSNIISSPCRNHHILEPNYGANDDDVSQGLDLPIGLGSPVLLAFTLRAGDEYICILCKEVLSVRVPRQLAHIDLRPFPCVGCDSCDPKYVHYCLPSFINVLTYP